MTLGGYLLPVSAVATLYCSFLNVFIRNPHYLRQKTTGEENVPQWIPDYITGTMERGDWNYHIALYSVRYKAWQLLHKFIEPRFQMQF